MAVRTEPATLRLAVVPRRDALTDAALVLAGALLVAGAAQITIPHSPVPITGQTFAVLLVGVSLGARLGAMSLALYWLLGLAGAPFYAEHKHGWDVFMGPTGGYLLGFIAAAAVTGYLAERRLDRRLSTSLTVMLTGEVLIYLFGLPWLAWQIGTGFKETLEVGLYPFVVGDLLKLYLAGTLVPTAWVLARR